ncbi:hypothetical protein [Clavibacter tessellarius]
MTGQETGDAERAPLAPVADPARAVPLAPDPRSREVPPAGDARSRGTTP